jgi:DNA repair protein RadC
LFFEMVTSCFTAPFEFMVYSALQLITPRLFLARQPIGERCESKKRAPAGLYRPAAGSFAVFSLASGAYVMRLSRKENKFLGAIDMRSINIFSLKQIKEKSVVYGLDSKMIRSPEDAYGIITEVLDLGSESVENFGIITLNTKNIVAGLHVLAKGTLNACLVHPREVFKAAILNNAASVVCFHNHPSGDPTPSPEDIKMTQRLMEVGEILGIEVLDHVIVGEGRFISLKEYGHI